MKKLQNYDIVLCQSPNLIQFHAPIDRFVFCMTNDGWDACDAIIRNYAKSLTDYRWHKCLLTLTFAGIGVIEIPCVFTKANAAGWDTRAAVEDYACFGYSTAVV